MDVQTDQQTRLKTYQNVYIQNHVSIEDSRVDGHLNKSRSQVKLLNFLFVTGSILVVTGFILWCKGTFATHPHHDHTVPTLLSVRSEDDLQGDEGRFLDSLSNLIYDEMKEAEFDENDEGQYKIKADKTEIAFHDSITLEWETNNIGIDDVGNKDMNENVIALYCPADEPNPKKFRDAATIAQIRTTNRFHAHKLSKSKGDQKSYIKATRKRRNVLEEGELNDSQWIIPSFPLVKEETCAFKLWVRRRNDYHADVRSRQNARFQLGASTGPVSIKNGMTQPTTIHLALTSSPSEMMVQFSTGAEGTPIVVYHQDEDVVTEGNYSSGLHINQGESTTYSAEDMCQQPATIEEPGKFSSPGMLHSVIMPGLNPNTKYYYKVGILRNMKLNTTDNVPGDSIVWSGVNTFKSPIASSSKEMFSFIVYADQGAMGYGNDDGGDRTSAMTKREVELNDIRSVHHIGDLSYAVGASHMWDRWLDMVETFSVSVPLMIGVGNHEYDHTDGGQNGKDPSGVTTHGGYNPSWGDFAIDSNGECGIPVSKRFKMPANGNGVFWYSYSYGNVHTIMLSSEHDLSLKSVQYEWLVNELNSVNRTITPWVLVEAHRPMYNEEDMPWNTKVGEGMRKEFEDLLHQYNVDLYLAGHYHSYMRSCSGLYKSKCNNGGPIHITIGTAGAELDNADLLNPEWAAKYILEWGYGRVTSVSNNELKWEFISDKDGSVKDHITLTK